MLFKKYIRKKIVKLLYEIGSHTEENAVKCSDDYVNNDKYKNNPYRGTFHGYICGVNWLSNEILKNL